MKTQNEKPMINPEGELFLEEMNKIATDKFKEFVEEAFGEDKKNDKAFIEDTAVVYSAAFQDGLIAAFEFLKDLEEKNTEE